MRFIIDLTIAIAFWTFTTFSVIETYQFFREATAKQISRGLNPTTTFTEKLIQKK